MSKACQILCGTRVTRLMSHVDVTNGFPTIGDNFVTSKTRLRSKIIRIWYFLTFVAGFDVTKSSSMVGKLLWHHLVTSHVSQVGVTRIFFRLFSTRKLGGLKFFSPQFARRKFEFKRVWVLGMRSNFFLYVVIILIYHHILACCLYLRHDWQWLAMTIN